VNDVAADVGVQLHRCTVLYSSMPGVHPSIYFRPSMMRLFALTNCAGLDLVISAADVTRARSRLLLHGLSGVKRIEYSNNHVLFCFSLSGAASGSIDYQIINTEWRVFQAIYTMKVCPL